MRARLWLTDSHTVSRWSEIKLVKNGSASDGYYKWLAVDVSLVEGYGTDLLSQSIQFVQYVSKITSVASLFEERLRIRTQRYLGKRTCGILPTRKCTRKQSKTTELSGAFHVVAERQDV